MERQVSYNVIVIMNKLKQQAFNILIVLSAIHFCIDPSFAAEDNAKTQDNTEMNVKAEQMLKQIQELQKKQEQQLAKIQGTTVPPPDINATINPVPIPVPTQSLVPTSNSKKPQGHSHFEYPFPEAQIRHSPVDRQVKDSAFSGAVEQVLPMNPQQIHRLKQIYNSAQFAAAVPAGIPPKPTATSLLVDLSPGASPPAIRLSEGFVTSLVFLDSTGAPWPLDAYDLGNPDAFNIAWDKKDNVLMVQAKTLYTYGNLAVKLRGLNTPLMLTLIPGQKVIDYRVDITTPGYGPNAKPLAINTGLPPQATPILLDVLDAIPPYGSRQLEISADIGQAWLLQGKMYIRTPFTLLSPGWLATMSSADGTNAYELQRSPMLLVSKNGKIVTVKIGGF